MDLSNWIDRHADFTPDKAALRYEGREVGYAEMAGNVHAFARMLKKRFGVGRGDRVAYLGLNSPEFLYLLFACARLGALFIPLNWRLAPPEHQYILQDAAAKVLICENEFRSSAEAIRPHLPDCEFVAADFADAAWLALPEALSDARGDDRNPHVGAESPLLLVYTSGTTGRPKGAVLTQEAIQWNALNSLHMHEMTGRDHVLTVLPMFHVGGLNIQTTPCLYAGGTVTLHRRFDPGAVAKAITQDRPTLLVLVPATMMALQAHADWPDLDLSSLRILSTGSSFVPPALIESFHVRGLPVIQVYGSTETCPVATYQRADDAMKTVGSVGKPALHCQIRIVDDAGRDLSAGESGEVLVKGPNVMFEYWGDTSATSQALRGGWYYTGDVGWRDEQGFYYINDRKKDVVISGGENIYPAELETVLTEMPEVAEAVVVGRPDERWGEIPVAIVVLRPGASLTPEDILTRFHGRLARFKHPKDVRIAKSLPRNVMGKVQKFQIREMIASNAEIV